VPDVIFADEYIKLRTDNLSKTLETSKSLSKRKINPNFFFPSSL
jgi:hypothetical protein